MKMFSFSIVFLDFYRTVHTNANVVRELLKLPIAKYPYSPVILVAK